MAKRGRGKWLKRCLGELGAATLPKIRTPIGRAYNLGTQLPTVPPSADRSEGWGGFAPPHHPAYMGSFGNIILSRARPTPAQEQTGLWPGPWPGPGPGQAREERPAIPFEQIEFVFKRAGRFSNFSLQSKAERSKAKRSSAKQN